MRHVVENRHVIHMLEPERTDLGDHRLTVIDDVVGSKLAHPGLGFGP